MPADCQSATQQAASPRYNKLATGKSAPRTHKSDKLFTTVLHIVQGNAGICEHGVKRIG